jgi:hypothetical protein
MSNKALYEACLRGDLPGALLAIERGANDWDGALWAACKGGHMALALLAIDRGARNWDWALRGACRGGHTALALLIVDKGASDWDWALAGACHGGYEAIALLMIEKGATTMRYCARLSPAGQYHVYRGVSSPDRRKELWLVAREAVALGRTLSLVERQLPLPPEVVAIVMLYVR